MKRRPRPDYRKYIHYHTTRASIITGILPTAWRADRWLTAGRVWRQQTNENGALVRRDGEQYYIPLFVVLTRDTEVGNDGDDT